MRSILNKFNLTMSGCVNLMAIVALAVGVAGTVHQDSVAQQIQNRGNGSGTGWNSAAWQGENGPRASSVLTRSPFQGADILIDTVNNICFFGEGKGIGTGNSIGNDGSNCFQGNQMASLVGWLRSHLQTGELEYQSSEMIGVADDPNNTKLVMVFGLTKQSDAANNSPVGPIDREPTVGGSLVVVVDASAVIVIEFIEYLDRFGQLSRSVGI